MQNTQHKLVIAEKPSVAKALADVLSAKSRRDGSYEGNGYIVSWCVGHLLGLAEPQAYDEKFAKWRREDLPITPKEWKYTAAASTNKQLKILVDLMKRSDVGTIINACDSGREGELIFRLVYNHAKCTKPIKRLWISSMEESAISEGFQNLKDSTEYDGLYHSAMCRQQADWLVGMNYSRLFSVLYNTSLRVGRVQTPTLAMIVEREQKIDGFVKEPFYVVGVSDGNFTAEREKVKDKSTAEVVRADCDGKIAVVKSVERKEKSESAPKLFDLTTLQREANRLFGYTAAQTLSAVQNLYEQKIVTYPRTDSRFITEDMADGIPTLVQTVTAALPFGVSVGNINTSQVVNNAKVTDHHAIIPTPAIYQSLGYTTTREEGMILLAEFNKDPWDIDKANITLAELYAMWWEKKVPKLGLAYTDHFKSAYKYCKSLHKLKYINIKAYHMQEIIDNCGHGAGTQRAIKVLWWHLDKYALELDLSTRSYSNLLKVAPAPETTKSPFTEDEVAKMWAKQNVPWVDSVLFLLYTGFRISELLDLRTENVNLENGTMMGGTKTQSGKNRVVPIHSKIRHIVEHRVKDGSEYLFSHNGKKCSDATYRAFWRNIMDTAEMGHTPHECRHTFRSRLDSAGANKRCIDLMMGHKSKDVGERVYTHKTFEELKTAIELLE